MKKIKQLIEERKRLLSRCNEIADSEEELTDELRTEFDAAETRIGELDTEIAKLEQLQKRQAEQDAIEKRTSQPTTPRYSETQGEHSEQEKRDLRQFSIGRAVQMLSQRQSLDGIEAEMAQEGQSEARASSLAIKSGAVMFSGKALRSPERRDMTATGGTNLNQGGNTIELDKAPLLDALFNSLVVVQAGAQVLNDLQGNIDLPRVTQGTAPAHKAENAAADQYDPKTAQLSLTPRRLPTYIKASNQLLIQSSTPSVDAFLTNHLRRLLSVGMERAFFNGGGTNEPVGILGTTGIGAVVGGTNGAAMDWADVVGLETAVSTDDALLGALRYITNAKVVGKLKTTARVASTDSMFIIDDRSGSMLNGYGYSMSNAVPSNLTKGSASEVCSAAIFGNWNDLVVANWSGIEVLVDPFTGADDGLTKINAAVYYDAGVVRPESFAAMKDILTT